MASAEPMEINSSMQWKMILAASILNGMAWLDGLWQTNPAMKHGPWMPRFVCIINGSHKLQTMALIMFNHYY
jgi:hypothetical protein